MTHSRYNKLTKTHLTLNEGEEFCETCRGEGMLVLRRDYSSLKMSSTLVCKDCLGAGKIDWIEKITGKKSHLPLVNLKMEKTNLVPKIKIRKLKMSKKKFLKEGEVLCDNCHGEAILPNISSVRVCTKCWGTGKLDWIELCTGKQIPHEIFKLPKVRISRYHMKYLSYLK